MKTLASHNSSQVLRLGLIVLVLFAALAAAGHALAASAAASAPYGWPVKPFDQQHPVRGSFGDPRTVFFAPPTAGGVLHGGGRFSFHEGIDISASNGTKVYPVRDGRVVVASLEPGRERVVVQCGEGVVFEYWHLTPHVRVGQSVKTDQTVLGTILRPAGHVHLTEVRDGRPVNPLAPGHIAPYSDHTAPHVTAIGIQSTADTPAMVNLVRGSLTFVAEAYDTPSLPVPGSWHGMPVAPALITWRIQTWTGVVVLPERTAVDFRTTIPADSSFWNVYARGTYQNMSVFGDHYSFAQPGCFLFRLTPTPFDTTRVKDGVYEVVVTATDVRGNSSTLSQRFSVHNAAGSVGV
jgi:murein DD-endopeptidase MepM/ murein hydrolase activator NlpD